jgi:membrane fusion protein (multidrug efflux system)
VTAVFGERAQARVIPEEALVPQAGRAFVVKLVDGPDQDTKIAQRVEVKVGLRRPGRVEVVEGLQPGDLVVTAGQQRVQRDGMPVRVIELSRPGATGAPAAGGLPPAGTAAPNGPTVASDPAPLTGTAAAPAAKAGALPARLAAARLNGPNPCAVADGSAAHRAAVR